MIFLIFISGGLLVISIYYGWQNFRLLFQPSRYKIWFYPKEIPQAPANVTKVKIPVTLQLPAAITVNNKTTYPIVVSGNLTLGFLFFYFLRIQSTYGQIATPSLFEEEQGWIFYSINSSGKRKYVLNPELTFKENAIKANGIIEAVKATQPQNLLG